MAQVKTVQELYDAFILELQARKPELTDTNAGSMNDVLAGTVATAVNEISQVVLDEFRKTFIETANGIEISGNVDELQTLVVDHFGSEFARPGAVKATGTVQFSRPNTSAGNVTILAGTVVKTAASASGSSQRFEVVSTVVLTGLTVNASVRALIAGVDGNVQANKVTVIESSLTDSSVIVNNSASFAGGEAEQNDTEYRETIRNLLKAARGGTLEAIKAKALTVGGVEFADAVEALIYAKEWDIGGGVTIGDYFAIPRARLYIADSNGTASQALIDDVKAAVKTVRAAGVLVEVLGATPFALNWSVSIVLNPAGPNYSTLQTDTTMIKDVMTKYINDLAIGADFVRSSAKSYLLSQFSSDLAGLTIVSPAGDISVDAEEKLIPGTMAVV